MDSFRPPSESAREDAEWIAAILGPSPREEKEACYAKLLSKYWETINVLVFGKIGDRREAEDLSQEAFVRAFRSLPRLRRPAAFLGWLVRIARNLVADHLRSRRREASLDALPADSLTADGLPQHGAVPAERRWAEIARGRRSEPARVEDELERSEDLAQVLAALRELPEPYREVVTLKYLEGLDGKTMALLLGEPEGTVRNRLFRALEKLRERLAGKAREGPRSPGGSTGR